MKNKLRRSSMEKLLWTTLLFVLASCAGRLTARVMEYSREFQAVNYADTPEAEATSADGNWSLNFPVEGQTPMGNVTADYLKQFNPYYCQDTQNKVIHFTSDAGYESSNAATTLDVSKKHSVPATFFLVGDCLEIGPDLVKRMVAEGHTVGNHILHHLDMFKISTKESFEKELNDLETLFQQTTG